MRRIQSDAVRTGLHPCLVVLLVVWTLQFAVFPVPAVHALRASTQTLPAGAIPAATSGVDQTATISPCEGTVVVPFVAGDATDVLQAALDSDACTVVIPNAGQPWQTGPLFVRRDGLTVALEPGAELLALPGQFPELGDSLLTVREVDGFTIRAELGPGPRPVLRMLNGVDPDYLDGEWRHGIKLVRTHRVRISGLTVADSGGDGVFVGGNWLQGPAHVPSTNVVIEDCAFVDNRRQGISVISVDRLRIRRCEFRDTGATSGTDPMAGIDFEPDIPAHQLIDCRVEDSVFINNRGSLYSSGIHMYLGNLNATTPPVDITIERCTIRSEITDGPAIYITGATDDGPATELVFRDVTVETARGIGLYARTSAANTLVLLERVQLLDTHRDEAAWLGAPIYLDGQSGEIAEYGGIEFIDCVVVDDRARPFIKAFEDRGHLGLPPARCRGLSGTITVVNPNPPGQTIDLDLTNDVDVTLQVITK